MQRSEEGKKKLLKRIETWIQEKDSFASILERAKGAVYSDPILFAKIMALLQANQYLKKFYNTPGEVSWGYPNAFLKYNFHMFTMNVLPSHLLWWYAGRGMSAAANLLIENQKLEKKSLQSIARQQYDGEVVYKLGFFIFGLFDCLDWEDDPINWQIFEPENLSKFNQLLLWFSKFLEQTVCISEICKAYYSPLESNGSGKLGFKTRGVIDIIERNAKEKYVSTSPKLRYLQDVKDWLLNYDPKLIEASSEALAHIQQALVTIPVALLNIICQYYSIEIDLMLNSAKEPRMSCWPSAWVSRMSAFFWDKLPSASFLQGGPITFQLKPS